MKQTAVEWLYNKMYEHNGRITIEEFNQAKEMELEQMYEAYMAGAKDVQALIQKQAIEEIDRLNIEGKK